MKRLLLFIIASIALPIFAADPADDCRDARALGALYQVRSLMMRPYASSYDVDRFIDRKLDELREPTGDGGYRWVRWAIPGGDAPFQKDGHLTAAVHDRGDSDHFEASSQHVFAVRIAVPGKRSLFNGNNRVFVGSVHVTYDGDGRSRTKDERIDQWMNPDTSRTIDLGGRVADRVRASLDAGADDKHVKESLVEIHFLQAVAEDDPANPNYPTVQVLQPLRHSSAGEIDDAIAAMERTLYPPSEPLPLLSIVSDLR